MGKTEVCLAGCGLFFVGMALKNDIGKNEVKCRGHLYGVKTGGFENENAAVNVKRAPFLGAR